MDAMLQYGALGLLALVLLGAFKLARVLVDRIAASFDAQGKALERIALILDRTEEEAARRHRVVVQSLRRLRVEEEDHAATHSR